MINVSSSYNPYSVVRDVDVEVRFDIINQTAKNKGTITVAEELEGVSQINQLTDESKTIEKFATCENNLTLLDGSFKFMPDIITPDLQTGWWSDSISDENGEFLSPPTMNINLSSKQDFVGFTMYFTNESYVKELIISTYSGNEQIYSEVFTSSSSRFIADLPVKDCNKIIIQITKTNAPFRRVKMCEFEYGIIKIWNRDSITSLSVEESADFIGDALPIAKTTIEFDNSQHEFDISRSTRRYEYKQALKDATITSNTINSISKINQLKNEKTSPLLYATFGDNVTQLDGKYSFLPDRITNDYEIGYLSAEMSNENGIFSNNPDLTMYWDHLINFSGFRLFFEANNYPTVITAKAFKAGELIHEAEYTNNTSDCFIDFAAEDCDQVIFNFNNMSSPYTYLKISELQVLRFSDSWFTFLSQDYPISVKFIVNGEEINTGNKLYFESVALSNGNLTAQIVAHDYVYNIDGQGYKNGQSGSASLDYMLKDILNNIDLDIEYGNDSLASYTVSRSTPKDTTKRAAIHYVAQASKATCWLDRNGILKIQPMDTTDFVDTFDSTNLYSMDILRLNDYVNMTRLSVKDEYTDPETTYTFWGGSGLNYREMENNCVYPDNGQEIADWLLQQKNRRLYFEMEHRGNPALEIGDTIRVIDKNGVAHLAVIYEQKLQFGSGLKASVKAISENY